MHKPAETSVNIHPLFASRWSPRAFDNAKPVTPQIITALKEAARWAPSCFGAEPWCFVFCDKNQNDSAWQALMNTLAPPNQAWAKDAPLLVLACAQTHFEYNNNPNRHCQFDTGAATLLLVLEAESQGLRCHQMAGFDAAKAASALAVPDGFECMSVIAAGYQHDNLQQLSDEIRERENAPRQRQPLKSKFFDGTWGQVEDDNQAMKDGEK